MLKHLYPIYVVACSVFCGVAVIAAELILVALFGMRSLGTGAYLYEKNHDFRLPVSASVISVDKHHEKNSHYYTIHYMWINSAGDTCLSSFWSAEKLKLRWSEVKLYRVGSDIDIHTTVTGCDSVVNKSDLVQVRKNLIKHRSFLFSVACVLAFIWILLSEKPYWAQGSRNENTKNRESLKESIRNKASRYSRNANKSLSPSTFELPKPSSARVAKSIRNNASFVDVSSKREAVLKKYNQQELPKVVYRFSMGYRVFFAGICLYLLLEANGFFIHTSPLSNWELAIANTAGIVMVLLSIIAPFKNREIRVADQSIIFPSLFFPHKHTKIKFLDIESSEIRTKTNMYGGSRFLFVRHSTGRFSASEINLKQMSAKGSGIDQLDEYIKNQIKLARSLKNLNRSS
jgi:hypothetical protein